MPSCWWGRGTRPQRGSWGWWWEGGWRLRQWRASGLTHPGDGVEKVPWKQLKMLIRLYRLARWSLWWMFEELQLTSAMCNKTALNLIFFLLWLYTDPHFLFRYHHHSFGSSISLVWWWWAFFLSLMSLFLCVGRFFTWRSLMKNTLKTVCSFQILCFFLSEGVYQNMFIHCFCCSICTRWTFGCKCLFYVYTWFSPEKLKDVGLFLFSVFSTVMFVIL